MKKTVKILIVVSIIMVSLVLALLVYMVKNEHAWQDLRRWVSGNPGMSTGIYKTVPLPATRDLLVECSNEYIYVYADKLLDVMDKNGETVNTVMISYDDVSLAGFPWGAAVYDKKRGAVVFFAGADKTNEQLLNKEIYGMAGFPDHAVILTGPKEGYLGSVVITDNKGHILSTTSYSSRYPVSAAVIDSGRRYVVCGMDFIHVDRTFLDTYQIYGTAPESGIQTPGTCPLVVYLNKDVYAAVGPDGLFVYNPTGNLLKEYAMESIQHVVSDMKSSLFVKHTKEEKAYLMKITNTTGADWDKQIGFDPLGMAALDDICVVWSRSSLTIFDRGSGFQSEVGGLSDVRESFLMNGDILLIHTADELVLYNLR
ncbi:MAG: DUF5711 family protein [Clostridia bacterium]